MAAYASDMPAGPDAFDGHRSVTTSAKVVVDVLENALRSTGRLDVAVETASAHRIDDFTASLAKSIAGIPSVCTCGPTGWIFEADVSSKDAWAFALERCLQILGRFALAGHGLGNVSGKRAILEIANFNAAHCERYGGLGIAAWTVAPFPFDMDMRGLSFTLTRAIPNDTEWHCCVCGHRIEGGDARDNGVFQCDTWQAQLCAACRRSPRPPLVSFFTALDALAESYETITVYSNVAPQWTEWPPLPPAGLHAPLDTGDTTVSTMLKPGMLINAVVSSPPQRQSHFQILRAIGGWQHVDGSCGPENGALDPCVVLVWKGCAWQINFNNHDFDTLSHALLGAALSPSPPSAPSPMPISKTFYSTENLALPFPGDSVFVLDLIYRLAVRAAEAECEPGAIAGGAHPGMCFAPRGEWNKLDLRSGGTEGLPDNVHFGPQNLRPDPRHLDLIDADLDALSPDLDLRKVARDLDADEHTAKTDVYCIALFAAWLWLGPRALSTILRVAICAAGLQPMHSRSAIGSTRLLPSASALFPFLVRRYLRVLMEREGLNAAAAEAVEKGLSSDPAERPSAISMRDVFGGADCGKLYKKQYASRRRNPVIWLGLLPPPEGREVPYSHVVDWLLPRVQTEPGAIVDWIQHCAEGALVIVWEVEGPSDVSFFGAVVQYFLVKEHQVSVEGQQRGFVLRWTSSGDQKVALRFEYELKDVFARVRAEMKNRGLDEALRVHNGMLRFADQSDNDLKAVNPNTSEHGLVIKPTEKTPTRRRLRWGRAVENYLVHPKEMLSLLRVQVPMPPPFLQFSAAWAFAMEMELRFAELYFPVGGQPGVGWVEPTSFRRAVANNCHPGPKTVDLVAAAYDEWKGVPHVKIAQSGWQHWFALHGAEASSFAASVCAGELSTVTGAQRTACRAMLGKLRAALVAVHLPLTRHGTDSLFCCPWSSAKGGANGQFLPGCCLGPSNVSVRPLTALASASPASEKDVQAYFKVLDRFKCLSCGAPALQHTLRAENRRFFHEQFAIRLSYGFHSHDGCAMFFEGDTFFGKKSLKLDVLSNPTAEGQAANLEQIFSVFEGGPGMGHQLVELREAELRNVVAQLVAKK